MTSVAVSCVSYQFYSLYILNGKLNPLIFDIIIEKGGFHLYLCFLFNISYIFFVLLLPLACFLIDQVNIFIYFSIFNDFNSIPFLYYDN